MDDYKWLQYRVIMMINVIIKYSYSYLYGLLLLDCFIFTYQAYMDQRNGLKVPLISLH